MNQPHLPQTRTNVRLTQRAIRATFRALTPLPSVASELAARLWFTPPRAPLRPEQKDWLERAERISLRAAETRVAGYSWGSGPAVLLVHGWGGHAGQLTSFVPHLVEAGFRAIAFDAPRHGATSGGTPSLLSFAEAAQAFASEVGGVDAVIAHSMGASASAYAMSQGLETNRAVFLAPAATMVGAAERFAQMVELHPRGLERMRRKFERSLGIHWDDLDVTRSAHRMNAPLLVVHDTGDRDVPYADGTAIVSAWPEATLVTTEGLGHHRLLRDAEVVRRALAFLSRSGADRAQR